MADFAPTHVVPEGGMQAWSAPDPGQAAVADLGAGTELRVTEERGAWAAVLASNGWTGWVDGRRLVARPAGSVDPAPPRPEPPFSDPAPQPEVVPESVQPEPSTTLMPAATAAQAETPAAAGTPRQPEPSPPGPPASGFRPTHVVPQGGVGAWTAPDPSLPAVATLHPGTLLRLDEQRGAWGRVAADNGWTGWVDARRLVVL